MSMKNRREMLTSRLLTGAMISAVSMSACADKWDLVGVTGESTYSQSSVWIGRPTGLNGKQYDFSSFYKAENLRFHFQGTATYQISDNFLLTLPFKFDAGYKSQLYDASPQINLGLGAIYGDNNLVVNFGLSNILSFGGKVTERPCYDSFDRAFHCGTALPWIDVAERLGVNEVPVRLSLRFLYRF